MKLFSKDETFFDHFKQLAVHIGTAAADGAGSFFETSHIAGSLRALRRGGPGCPVDIYVP